GAGGAGGGAGGEEPGVRVSETDDFAGGGEEEEGGVDEAAGEPEVIIDEVDGAGERVLYRGHPAWVSFWRGLLVSGVLLVAGLVGWDFSGWLLFGGLVVALLVYGHMVFMRSMREYLVTERRVEVIHGLISKSSEEVRVCDIRAINVRKEGVKGLIGVGSVEFASAGSDGSDVVFEDVMGAHRLKENVRRLQDKAAAG
ncbi:MAG: PH domain-containing protein, partial [Verrucomicrobiota bacterium]